MAELLLSFPPFRIDSKNSCVWRGKKRIALTPKDFAVLHCLAVHPGQLVTHEELLRAVWDDTVVSQGVLKVCMRRIRQALNDSAKKPRFIETLPKQGYRLIAPVQSTEPEAQSLREPRDQALQFPISFFVGRERELERLDGWLEKALRGERQLVFITGEPGIGKTTLVRAFLRRVVTSGEIAIGRGQCIEHYGPGEAYMPVLEALGRICRAPGGERLVQWMKEHAPTWLVQMPALLSATDLKALQRKVQGATHERMLREMIEGIEVLTTGQLFVLVLEDLHWSDVSTLELIAALARRQERARLLIIGTYRPEEMMDQGRPLKGMMQELPAHKLCAELALGLLSEAHIAEYLGTRFPGNALPSQLAQTLHQRTEGNPLFLINLVDDLVDREVLVQDDQGGTLRSSVEGIEGQVPENIRQLVAKQRERLLPEEQRVLQAASVAGREFSSAAVAAALETDVEEVEEWCEGLASRQHFLRSAGVSEWPDGTGAARYGFLHALYQQLWHERVGIGRRQRLHRQIGERQEAAYGDQAGEIAAELAVHFQEGRDYERAVRYLHQAAGNAMQRSASQEAISLLTKGLELLKILPDTPARAQQELSLQTTLGPALMAAKGYAASEVERAYARARELCQQVEETSELPTILVGLGRFYHMRGEHHIARELGEELLKLAQRMQNPDLLTETHQLLGAVSLYMGELDQAKAYLEQGIVLPGLQQQHDRAVLYGQDAKIACLSAKSHTLWLLGYPEQALQCSIEALTLGRELVHPFSLAFALPFASLLHHWRGERQAFQAQVEELMTLATEQEFTLYLIVAKFGRGWLFSEQGNSEEGCMQIQQAIIAWRAMGAELALPFYLSWLAWAYREAGQLAEGLQILAEALAQVDRAGERYWEAELYRLKGELLLQSKVQDPKSKVRKSLCSTVHRLESEAEECFQKAVKVARRQSAKSLELRAGTSLSRLWQHQGKREEARQLLAEVYGWFTEGFDTADLQEAKALLEELSEEQS